MIDEKVPAAQRYDAEVAASLKLTRAVTDIISRSPHAQFRRHSRRLLKVKEPPYASIALS